MPSKIVVSRRIYVPVLILAIVLVALVIGRAVTRAQGLVEYDLFYVFCKADDGTVTVKDLEEGVGGEVVIPECEDGEERLIVMSTGIYSQSIIPMEEDIEALAERISVLEDRLDACRACPILPRP